MEPNPIHMTIPLVVTILSEEIVFREWALFGIYGLLCTKFNKIRYRYFSNKRKTFRRAEVILIYIAKIFFGKFILYNIKLLQGKTNSKHQLWENNLGREFQRQ